MTSEHDKWPTSILLDLFGIDVPVLQAPMAGAGGVALATAVSNAGGLGALPCGMLNRTQAEAQIDEFRAVTNGPLNLNFFCHEPAVDTARDTGWRRALQPYYDELGIREQTTAGASRQPFNEEMCAVVEAAAPSVVSFHFGLPVESLLVRVKDSGAIVLSTATTVSEARWLEARGCDVVIAQGYEGGGHRGMFLDEDLSTQLGTMALVPQVVDAVSCPVVAAGGIGDGRGIVAALALGAAAVQLGTAYLLTPQSLISDLHRQALLQAEDNHTALTNVFSGGPGRGLMNRLMREAGPMSEIASHYPDAGIPLAPLKAAAEADGKADFSSLWSGQYNRNLQSLDAGELTRQLAEQALAVMRGFG